MVYLDQQIVRRLTAIMALIKCAECGNEISEYSESCPHCGCPTNKTKEIITQRIKTLPDNIKCPVCRTVNNSDFLRKNNAKCKACGADLSDLKKLEDEKIKYQERKKANELKPCCPKCGNTQFTPVRKKFSLLTGFATNKVDLICNNCGTKINPK